MTDIRHGPVLVIRQRLDVNGRTAGAVPFVVGFFIIVPFELPGPFFNGQFNVVFGPVCVFWEAGTSNETIGQNHGIVSATFLRFGLINYFEVLIQGLNS